MVCTNDKCSLSTIALTEKQYKRIMCYPFFLCVLFFFFFSKSGPPIPHHPHQTHGPCTLLFFFHSSFPAKKSISWFTHHILSTSYLVGACFLLHRKSMLSGQVSALCDGIVRLVKGHAQQSFIKVVHLHCVEVGDKRTSMDRQDIKQLVAQKRMRECEGEMSAKWVRKIKYMNEWMDGRMNVGRMTKAALADKKEACSVFG